MSVTQRKLTTIFAADVQGYSRLMEADEEGTLATLKQYRDAMARLIGAHGGRVVNTWGDGLYFARYRMKTRNGKGTEVRRVTLGRRGGRFSRRPDFYRRATCDLLPSYKLERAAFGGRRRTPLRIAYRVAGTARTQLTVLRGKKVVKRFTARTSEPRRTPQPRNRAC